jgi:hypothetical protein
MKSLLEQGQTAEKIFESLTKQQTELVLTAHPTEVNRRTILEKQRRVQHVRYMLLLLCMLYILITFLVGLTDIALFIFYIHFILGTPFRS